MFNGRETNERGVARFVRTLELNPGHIEAIVYKRNYEIALKKASDGNDNSNNKEIE